MVVSRVNRNPLWATLVGALVAAMVVSFFVFVRSGEAVPRAAADGQPASASVVSPEIIGGTAVPDGKYLFMAYIKLYRNGKPFAACSGTLIDPDSVLTAAHCLVDTSGATVVVGRTDLRQRNQGQEIAASEPFIHPRYNHPAFAYDVGVLMLSRPVKGIKPIKLATAKQNNLETPGRKLTVAGWGVTKPKGKLVPPRMREVSVPVVSDSRADRAYATAPPSVRAPYYPSLQVAAGEKGKDSCVGDSGGPLFDPGSRTEVGITDYGPLPCAQVRYPGIYTEVNNPQIRKWILWAAKR